MMNLADVGTVPIGHQGDADEVRVRIGDLGSSAVLAFDGGRHVAQLQLRRYEAGRRSPRGLDEPLYWMDFDGHVPPLPERTIVVFCYHVGQTDDSDARDPRYWDGGWACSSSTCWSVGPPGRGTRSWRRVCPRPGR